MQPYRKTKETRKIKAMITRVDRLLAGKVPRGGKGELGAARARLRNALKFYEARDRKAAEAAAGRVT